MSAWLEAGFAIHRPRAIAALTRTFRDIDLAEEAFAEACVKAVDHWQKSGTPAEPFAWLLTVARNAALDRLRTASRRRKLLAANPDPDALEEGHTPALPDPNELRDDVLRLMFICCHPALSRQDQLALALKVVAGLSVPEVARAFLIRPKSMEQRLTRAKRCVSENPVPFETPSAAERGHRLGEVSAMVYLMFNEGWSATGGAAQIRHSLCQEAIRLARLLLELFPGMGEQTALLALLLFQDARKSARLDASGKPIALADQDRGLWDRGAIAEGVSLLQKAQRHGPAGPYLIQAAIAAEHGTATTPEGTDWHRIEALYSALYALEPTPVVRLNQIAAMERTQGPKAALAAMAELAAPLASYRWYHTMHATLLARTGATTAAVSAYQTALTLSPTEPERQIIEKKIAEAQEISPTPV